jgi:murein DD-endopeptidase MepM/ murein hydrolase activator NlpD
MRYTIPGRLGAVALAATLMSACSREVPEVGRLSAIEVPSAERVEIFSLGRGQTFGGLLWDVIDANEQNELLLAFQEHASPRRLRQGTEVTLRYLREDGELRGVDVAVTPDETVRLDRDVLGWRSDLIETPVYVDTLFATGEIETVFWSAVVENPELAGLTFEDRNRLIDHLDRVFQWQVDFSRQIRVGDTYRFAFEREVRPDGSMRAGRLLAAEFVNSGTPYHAVYFDPNGDGEGSYFDLEGESVRRAFLLKPLSYRRISGRYSSGRRHPILNTIRAHRGVDYAADTGTPIMATSDGVVIHRAPKGSFGNTVEIRHPNGFVTRYAHLSSYRAGVVVGTRVKQSDVIGYVGMTGLASGPHLHYEMMRSGRHMDPLSVDLPAGDPVPSEDLVRWRTEMTTRVSLLEFVPRTGPVRTFVTQAEQADDDEQPPAGGSQ